MVVIVVKQWMYTTTFKDNIRLSSFVTWGSFFVSEKIFQNFFFRMWWGHFWLPKIFPENFLEISFSQPLPPIGNKIGRGGSKGL